MLLLGAHLSIAGGLYKAISLARELECNCLQVFVKNQRQWQASPLSDAEVDRWREARLAEGDQLSHIVAHSGYLINLASDREEVRRFSLEALLDELDRCERLGIDKLVLHPGSHRGQGTEAGLRLVTEGLNSALAGGGSVTILLETTAGAGNALGGKIEEIARLIDESKYPERLGCCLDTCHLFAAGYPLSPDGEIDGLLTEIDRRMGLAKVGCIHMNDSKGELGSHLDRHEHIGKGCIGIGPFQCLIRHAKLEKVPKIIETPKGPGDRLDWDRENLSLLRELSKKTEWVKINKDEELA